MTPAAVSIVHGRSGHPTLQVQGSGRYLHSLYQPVKEAQALVASWNLPTDIADITVIGLGLGYHVLECLSRSNARITVLEWNRNVLQAAFECFPQLKGHPRLDIVCAVSDAEVAEFSQTHNLAKAYFHPPSLAVCPFPRIRWLLQEMQMLRVSTERQAPRMAQNFMANAPQLRPDSILTGQAQRHHGALGVLIAAGPSLDAAIPALRHLARQGTVLVCVAGVLRRLLDSGIRPDYVVMSDSSVKSIDYVRNLTAVADCPPLLALPTVHPDITGAYPGQVMWALQSGYELTEAYARAHQIELFQTGGSVATLALSILYYFGCNPITFVGQDLAYVNGMAYSNGLHSEVAPHAADTSEMVTTRSVQGTEVVTTLSWNAFRHWIEGFIREHSDRTYLNASQGAEIAGAPFATLEAVMKVGDAK